MGGRCGVLVGTDCGWCVECVVYWLELAVGDGRCVGGVQVD